MNRYENIVLAVTGASGAIYASRFIEKVRGIPGLRLSIVFTDTARQVWAHETGLPLPDGLLDNHGFDSPFCSGSAAADCMVILPCSMGSLARIAAGTANDAVARIADVQLKERRRLVIVPREAPYNLIHLRNMTFLHEAGAVICPASPAFYAKPSSIGEMVDAFVSRVMQEAGIQDTEERYRWKNI